LPTWAPDARLRSRHVFADPPPTLPGVELLTQDLDDEAEFEAVKAQFHRARATHAYRRVFWAHEPLVSVCITTADRSEILQARALKSVTEQTYKNLQVIIVGDCCEADTIERIATFRDPRFQYVNLPKRGPYPRPGYARWQVAGTYPANAALRLVRGPLVTHLDEDDAFEPRRIETLVKTLQETRSDLVFHQCNMEGEDRSWSVRGNGEFIQGQVGTGTVLYHHWLARIPWDLFAYRRGEPGDWNRFRKFKALGARLHFVPESLVDYYKYPLRDPFVAKPGEEFLDEGPGA
jgi:glycosyltransferase involved in cell wall biosynthesis